MGWIARLASVHGVVKGIRDADFAAAPDLQFQRWFRFAKRVGVYMPNAMTLATSTPDGTPSARIMLLKGWDARGLVFYTNYESRKGAELSANPRASTILHWVELHRQIRAEGMVTRLTAEESTRYFHSRPRGSQIGAWASHQSRPVASRKDLDAAYDEAEKRYAGGPVPLPPYWGGFRLSPEVVEFWQGRVHRFHDRLRYERKNGAWTIVRLSP